MRVLLLNYEFPPLGGGAANATHRLLKEFAGREDLVVDLVTSSTGSYREDRFAPNVTIYYLDIGKKGSFHFQTKRDILVYSVKAFWKARSLVRKHQYSLVHAFFGIPCGFIALFLGLPVVISLRGSDVPFHNPKYYWIDKMLFQYLSVIVWSKARKIVVNSRDLRKEVLAIYDDTKGLIEVIPNGVDTAFFRPIDSISKVPALLYVGRLAEVKGIRVLMEVFARLGESEGYPLDLWLVGDGPMRGTVSEFVRRKGLNGKVKLWGRLEQGELVRIYNQAMFFVLPSLKEGMSNALLEALACGLPVVVTRTGGAEELVKGSGFLVDPGSVEDLLTKLRLMLHLGNQVWERMSCESRRLSSFYSWEKVAQDYLSLYKQYNNVRN